MQNDWTEPLTVIGLTIACFMALLLVTRVANALAKVNRIIAQQGSEPLSYRMDESCLRVTDAVGTIEFPWNSFVGYGEFPRHIDLKLRNGVSIMIVVQDFPLDALEWIRERFRTPPDTSSSQSLT